MKTPELEILRPSKGLTLLSVSLARPGSHRPDSTIEKLRIQNASIRHANSARKNGTDENVIGKKTLTIP